MNISEILRDRNNRIRSGWRVGIFFLLFMAVLVAVSAVVYPFAAGLRDEPGTAGQAVGFVLGSLVMLLPALGVGWFCGRVLEHLPFRALGAGLTAGWFRHFAVGCLIGGATLLIAVLAASAGGGLRFSLNSGGAVSQTLIASLAVFAVAAAAEEALFRGYALQTFARSGLGWPAVVVTSLLFGWAHANNPNVSWIAVLNTVLAGVWFGVAYLKTRDLWFVWGLHLAWNWMQGSVFGIEVSGLTDITRFPLLHESDAGPVWLTGGEYGLEGGIGCTIALIVSAAVIHFLPVVSADTEMLALTEPPHPPRTNDCQLP